MTMDDPGWGDYTPLAGEHAAPPAGDDTASIPVEPHTQPTGTLTPEPASTSETTSMSESTPTSETAPMSETTPGSARPPGTKMPSWLSPLRLAIGAGVVVVAIVVGVVVALSSGSSSPSGPKLLSKADYITKADAICLNFRDQIQAASATGDLTAVAHVAQSELDQIRLLGDPDQDADIIRTFLDNETQAINYLVQGDSTDANPVIATGDAAAGQFGMRVCNYGH